MKDILSIKTIFGAGFVLINKDSFFYYFML